MKKYYSLETTEKTATVVIYGDITSWPWTESDVSSYNLEQELAGLDVDKIEVHINSYGGEVNEALAITNTLLRHPAKVTTYVDGFACSAATIIFMAGDERIMSPLSNFLVHPAWSYIQGNADDLRKEADNLDTITAQSINAYMARIGDRKTRDELVDLMSEERFLTPEETVEWGFATAIDDLFETGTPTQSVKQAVFDKLRDNNKKDIDALAEKLDKVQETLDDLLRERQETEKPIEEPQEEPEQNDEPTASYMARFFNAMNQEE